jgi:ABC-2 type transport system ATP-binding protein
VNEVLDLVGLSDVARRRAGGFSLGMAQRLGIAAAMLGDPPVLLFDEPINGLDPDGIRWIRAFLRSLAAEGRVVLVSSHLMGELEGIADELVVIGRGRLIAQTSVEELLASRSDGRVHVRTPQLTEVMAALAGAGGTVTSTGADALVVTGLQPERIAALVSEHGLRLDELYRGRATLEDAFIDLTRDAIDYVAERPGRQR